MSKLAQMQRSGSSLAQWMRTCMSYLAWWSAAWRIRCLSNKLKQSFASLTKSMTVSWWKWPSLEAEDRPANVFMRESACKTPSLRSTTPCQIVCAALFKFKMGTLPVRLQMMMDTWRVPRYSKCSAHSKVCQILLLVLRIVISFECQNCSMPSLLCFYRCLVLEANSLRMFQLLPTTYSWLPLAFYHAAAIAHGCATLKVETGPPATIHTPTSSLSNQSTMPHRHAAEAIALHILCAQLSSCLKLSMHNDIDMQAHWYIPALCTLHFILALQRILVCCSTPTCFCSP